MRRSKDYPLTFGQISNHHEYAVNLFEKIKPHKETFIDVVVLEGAFLCENPSEIYKSLQIGERLALEIEPKTQALIAIRESGEKIGKIPFTEAILPSVLISRGISLWAYAEAKEFQGDILEIAVSIYCENY